MAPQPANSTSSGTPKIHCMLDAHLNVGILGKLEKKDILNIAIVSTMDIETAKDREIELTTEEEEKWKQRTKMAEQAALENPLRLFPLYSYDPRRHKFSESSSSDKKDCLSWDEPFTHIVGCDDYADGIKKNWLGFCVDPTLGVGPYNEFCECLPLFYEKCEAEDIPILVRCTPDKIPALSAKSYNTVNNDDLDPFYQKYKNPKDWGLVLAAILLAHFPKLRLCLAGFGGNEAWKNKSVRSWALDYKVIEKLHKKQQASNAQFKKLATIDGGELIYSVILLTKHTNVYTDISGLDISNDNVKYTLKRIVTLAFKNDENYKHLKDKIIFGSGWDTELAQKSDENGYSKCCDGIKRLFEEIESDIKKEDNTLEPGEIWGKVSLINPWKCYLLSKEKLRNIYDIFKGGR